MPRKTIEVEAIKESVNRRLQVSDSSLRLEDMTPTQAFRLGAASLLEEILHATDNYRGFNYQASEKDSETHALLPAHDDTRRIYY